MAQTKGCLLHHFSSTKLSRQLHAKIFAAPKSWVSFATPNPKFSAPHLGRDSWYSQSHIMADPTHKCPPPKKKKNSIINFTLVPKVKHRSIFQVNYNFDCPLWSKTENDFFCSKCKNCWFGSVPRNDPHPKLFFSWNSAWIPSQPKKGCHKCNIGLVCSCNWAQILWQNCNSAQAKIANPLSCC